MNQPPLNPRCFSKGRTAGHNKYCPPGKVPNSPEKQRWGWRRGRIFFSPSFFFDGILCQIQTCWEMMFFFDAQSLKLPKFKPQKWLIFFTNNFLLVFEAKHLWKSKSCLLYNIWEKEYTCSCTCFDPDKRGGGHVDPHWDFFLKNHRLKREFIHHKICQYVSKTILQSTLLDVDDISSNIFMTSYFHTLSLLYFVASKVGKA